MIDLALLAPEWTIRESQVTLTTNTQLILPANQRRFCAIFCYFGQPSPPDAHENFAFLTQNSNPLHFGFILRCLDLYTFEFQKYAALVQGEWWARESGSNITFGGVLTFTEILQTARVKSNGS